MDLELQSVRIGQAQTRQVEMESTSFHSKRNTRQLVCESMNMDAQAKIASTPSNRDSQSRDKQRPSNESQFPEDVDLQRLAPYDAQVSKPNIATKRCKTTGDTPVSQRGKIHQKEIPNLDGKAIPESLRLEAQLFQDFSHGSHISERGRRQQKKPARFDKPAHMSSSKESSSSSYVVSCSTSDADSDFLVQELEAAMKSPVKKIHHQENHRECSTSTDWVQCETMIMEAFESERTGRSSSSPTHVATGQWKLPSLNQIFTKKTTETVKKWAKNQSKEVLNTMARESTYAVVTFTSRQAAVAARHCLADGRGSARWITMTDIPIPPLADAAPGDLTNFRNCCRPVTVSINDRQKNCRNYM
jgi:hypothetical protein